MAKGADIFVKFDEFNLNDQCYDLSALEDLEFASLRVAAKTFR